MKRLSRILSFSANQPNPSLGEPPNRLWTWILFGLLTLPLLPNLGSVTLVGSSLGAWKRYYKDIVRSPLSQGFALFSVWLLITTLFAVKPIAALEGLFNFLPYIAVFVAVRHVFRTFNQLLQFAWFWVLSAIPITLLGFGQIGFGWGHFAILKIFGTDLVPYGTPEGRISSAFMYANLCAAFLLTAFIFAIGLTLIYTRQGRREKQASMTYKLAVLIFSLISNGIALILTNSRSAWGLLFLIIVSFALYLRWRWLVLGLATTAGTILWSAWGPIGREPLRQVIPAYFWARLSDELYPDRYMTAFRSTQWQIALEMWVQHPWLGWGLRNFSPYYKSRMNTWLGHPHNFFLMLLAEIGIIGTILFCGLVGSIIFQAVNYYRYLCQEKLEWDEEKTLFFCALLAFFCCILFNFLDVTLFDYRVNLANWLLLAAISGIVTNNHSRKLNY